MTSCRRFAVSLFLAAALACAADGVFLPPLGAAPFPDRPGAGISDVSGNARLFSDAATTAEPLRRQTKATHAHTTITNITAAHAKTAQDKIAPDLQNLLNHAVGFSRSDDGRIPQAAFRATIRVVLHTAKGAVLHPDAIERRGGKLLRQRVNVVTAELPFDKIEDICTEKEVVYVRLPHRFAPLAVVGEGVALTGADHFHTLRHSGAGVRVAVIDVGFKNLTESIAGGHLPMDIFSRDFTDEGLETRYKHGTACAEIVHGMAPDAELHLLKIDDEEDLNAAYDYCLEKHIDILSLSIGTFGSGPGDGTGPVADFCDEALANGMLVVAAAGNGANFYSSDNVPLGTHWKGAFSDANQDTIHEFLPDVQGNILLTLIDHDDDGNPLYDEATVTMRWNDWPAASTDYDIYLYHYDYQTHVRGSLAASSAGVQNGSQPPVESIVLDLPEGTPHRFYELVVVRKPDSPVGTELEITTLGGNSFFIGATRYAAPIATSAGSIVEPADAESAFAVGAIGRNQWSFGPQEDYSSQGPTNARTGSPARIKPDICGPDDVASYTYGVSFPGTSAATPHVAGGAALLKSLHPELSPSEIRLYLESWAQDMGSYGKDNQYGWGRLRLLIHSLFASRTGSGAGTISGSPGGIDCGESCQADYASGMNVTLTAVPEGGSVFAGWEGACSGTGPCTVTMTESRSVTAMFTKTHVLSISRPGTGSGVVASSPGGINCGHACLASFLPGTVVTLTAIPAAGSTFAGWSGGGCTGFGNCTLIADGDVEIRAMFTSPAGNINRDDVIDLEDAILSLRVLANRKDGEADIALDADVNGDSKIGAAEVLYILQKISCLR